MADGKKSMEEQAQKQRDRAVLGVFYRNMPPPNNPIKEFDELYATKNEKDTIVHDLEKMYLEQKKKTDDSRFKEELSKLKEELQ